MSISRTKILYLTLVASVAINIVLAHKLTEFRHLSSTHTRSLLKPGTVIPPFVAVDLRGARQTIAFGDQVKPTVLYIFTPPCSWCSRNMENLKALLDKETGHYRFIGLSLSEASLAEYVAKNDLKLPVYSGLLPETLKTYKLGSTPQTIVVSPEGKVLQDWVGAYVGDQKSQVEAYFHLSLPGLQELPKAEAATN